jgi:hypothetical protein
VYTTAQPPTLPAYTEPGTGFLRAWCPYCLRWHLHGQGAGHRAAHCRLTSSPLMTSGYTLIDAGPWNPADWDTHGNRKQQGAGK